MSIPNVPKTNTFAMWRQKFNDLAIKVGDLDLLQAPLAGQPDLVSALNAVQAVVIENERKVLVRAIACA